MGKKEKVPCKCCKGTGKSDAIWNGKPVPCGECGGTGKV